MFRIQVPALCLHNIMRSHSFHFEAAAVGGFEQLWSNVRWIKLISAVPATAHRWYNESSQNFWSYFQSYIINVTDISIHMPPLKTGFDVWFPVSFEMDHDYNNMSFFLSLVDRPIASVVEGDSPKNNLCFWLFSDLVIIALENYLYHARLSFKNCHCRKSIK